MDNNEHSTNLAEVGTDCISRQQAIDRVTKEHDFFRGAVTVSDKARRDELLNVIWWLGKLPSIQPKRGRWEQKDFKYHCSCCDGIAPKAIRWDFCPHCGAKMEVTT